jgi:hypothetical protein
VFPAADLRTEGTEAEVAVGHERARAELIGQGQSPSIVGFGFFDMRWIALCRNVTEGRSADAW